MKKLLESTRSDARRADDITSHWGLLPGRPARAKLRQDLSSAIGQTLAQLLKRPEITIEQLAPPERALPRIFRPRILWDSVTPMASLSSEVRNELKSVETEIKYEGYLCSNNARWSG